MKQLCFTLGAERDYLDAIAFYEEQRYGLAAEFINAVDEAAEAILEQPTAYGLLEGDIRGKLLHRFPYSLYYRVSTNEILVLAVAHGSRRPGYWKDQNGE